MPRRFQFSLRALLVGTALAATMATYIAHTAEIVRMRNALRRRFHDRSFCLQDSGLVGQNSQQLSWLRRMMGDHPVGMLFYDPSLDKTGDILRDAETIFPEAEIGTIEERPDPEEGPAEVEEFDWPEMPNAPSDQARPALVI